MKINILSRVIYLVNFFRTLHRGSRRRPWGRRRLREGEDEGVAAAGFGGAAAAGFGGFCGLSRKRERPVAAISTNLESGIG